VRIAEPSLTYTLENVTFTVDDYLARTPTTGLLVARENTILVERYQYGRTDRHRLTSYSMAKTVTAMLIGIAIAEGQIRSIDDLAATYVPALAGTEYGRTSLRHLLQMSSGVAFSETYQPGDDVSELGKAVFSANGPGSLAAVKQFNKRGFPQGTHFNYSSADSVVLGLVLRRAVGVPLAEYLSTRIWKKLGAEADAGWDIDASGQEITFCCMVATLRDWARLGLMLANDGAWNGQQIVPRQWVLDATTVVPGSHLAAGERTGPAGYGYQVWVSQGERRRFNLMGIRGQMMTVDPAAKLVMVHTAVRPNAGFGPANLEFGALIMGTISQYALK